MGLIIGLLTAVIAAATTVVKTLAVAGLAIQGLREIGNSLMNLGKSLGLIKPETQIEKLGDRALQAEADGIEPGQFSSYMDYLKKVEEYELDAEKTLNFSEEEKLKKGMELAAGVMVEEYREFPMEEFCIAVGQNPEYFTSGKLQEMGRLIEKNAGYIPEILHYVDGTEKDEQKLDSVITTLTEIEKNTNPELSDTDALQAVLGVRKL